MKFLRVKKAEVQQPNKPKPTTMLPDNMEWAWDPDAADWVAVLKDNTNTTPPLYNPNNQNVATNTTTYMSNIKSASVINGEEDEDPLSVKLSDLFLSDSSLVDSYIKKEINCDDILNILGIEIKNENEYKEVCNYVNEFINDNYMRDIKSSSSLSVLPKLLDKVWYDYDEENAGKYAQIGSWEIGLGGYDTGYEVSYNGTPIFSITEDNELKPYMSDDRLQKDFGFSYSDVEKALKKHRDLENLKMINASQKDIEEVADSIINTYSGEEELEVLKEYSRKMRKEPIGVFNVMVDNAARRWGLNPNELMGCIMKKDRALVKQIVNLTIEENKKDLDDSVKKLSSKKVKSAKMKSEKFDGSAFEELKHNAKLCGDEIWSSVNGSLIKVLAYFPIENGKYNVLYEKITDMFNGIGDVSDIKVNKDENFKFYKECEPATIDFSSLELLPGDDTYEQIGFVRNSSVKCLSEFLDGPRYSKEIKIEAGLIKNGLVKYAGFDFNRGTKYAITTKGLEVLRKASEKEHNEALNEREKLAYMFGFNTDKETTLDTTGKVIKSDELSKCEWCGEEFDESELEDTELGKVCYRCKKGIESKEGPMNNKNISEAKQYLEKYLLENPELFKYQYGKDNVEEVLKELIEENPNWYKKFSSKKWTICESDGTPLGKVTASSELDAKVKFGIEHPEYAESLSISAKEIKSAKQSCIYVYDINWNDERNKYMDVDNQLPLLPKSETLYESDFPHDFEWEHIEEVPDYIMQDAIDGILYKMHDVQPYSFEYEIKTGNKEIDAQYEQTTNTKEPYPNPSETPHDDIVLENHDGWVNTADNHFKYTEEQKRLLPLFKLVNEYVAKKQIQLTEDVQNEENTIATGSAEVINELEHKVKDLGFYCEPIAEITDNDGIGQDIYSLKIFTK